MQTGALLAHYEILSPLGKGGMGEVWRARDTKLGREVAIKTLPEEFAKDTDRLARFEREAKLLASLNHPNIAAIYGLEEHAGIRFLVLELVEGPTLGDRIKQGAIPVEECLKLALQIAEALEAAHEKGVIHRDLKPANIKITPDGKVKVLDFGLAKAFEGNQADVSVSNSPTLSMAATQAGIILGTAAYMSPEQASGMPTDKRADIWSFGAVLFEMLSGRQTFTGKTMSHTLAAVLNTEPDWGGLPPTLHPRLCMLLERCLEKEAADRYHDIADARVDLRAVLSDPGGVFAQPSPEAIQTPPQSRIVWVAATSIVTALIVGVGMWILSRPVPQPSVRLTAVHPADQIIGNLYDADVVISPDGRRIAYITQTAQGNGLGQLYTRALNELEPTLLANRARAPFFSPDGQWVGFAQDNPWALMRVAATGGPAILISAIDGAPRGITWGGNDSIVFGTSALGNGLFRISPSGGEPNALTTPNPGSGEVGHVYPEYLPGGRAVLFTITNTQGIDNAQIAALDLDTGEIQVLVQGGSSPRYAASGHLVYGVAGTLRAVAFDPDSLAVGNAPVPVLDGVITKSTGGASYSISPDGTLAYLAGEPTGTLDTEGVLALVSRDGAIERLETPPARYRNPRISPDGERVAVEILDNNGGADIWLYDLSGGSQMRVLTQEGNNTRPVWTPGGDRVSFASDRGGPWGIYSRPADGSALAQQLTTADAGVQHYPESWSPDGRTLSYVTVGNEGGWDLWTHSLDSGTSEVFRDRPANQFGSVFSPDGRWLAYTDSEEVFGIYVQPFPPTGVIHRIAQSGEAWPVWGPDGREIFYRLRLDIERPTQLMGMNVTAENPFTFGSSRLLQVQDVLMFQNYRDYDIAPDGEQFVVILPADAVDLPESSRPQINIVLNWIEELKERVPAP